jgi:urease accessory protein
VDASTTFSEAPTLQRATGELAVSLKRRGAASVVDGLRQVGCLKARFPRSDDDAGWLSVVTLNTSGGVAGGDQLDSAFTVGPGARGTIASQAAERYYRALPGSRPSSVRNRIVVAEGGLAEWLPQETILFDRCSVRRNLRVELAEEAQFLGIESLVFGRAAMGEAVHHGSLRDVIELRRGGRLLLHDAVRLEGDVATKLRRKTIADGARALATVVYVAPDAEAMLEPLRRQNIATSSLGGMLIARMLGADGAALRSSVIEVFQLLRGERPLPRVWLC